MGADGRGPKLSGWKLLFIGIEFFKWIYVANPEKDIRLFRPKVTSLFLIHLEGQEFYSIDNFKMKLLILSYSA